MTTEDTHRVATLERLIRSMHDRMLPDAFLNAVLEVMNELRRPSPVMAIDNGMHEVPRCGCGAMSELCKQADLYCSRLEELIAQDREATAARVESERRAVTEAPVVAGNPVVLMDPKRRKAKPVEVARAGFMQPGNGERLETCANYDQCLSAFARGGSDKQAHCPMSCEQFNQDPNYWRDVRRTQ